MERGAPSGPAQETLPQILPGVDKDVVNVVLRSFKGRKIDVRKRSSFR